LSARARLQSARRRLAWVTAFCIGPFGGNERTWKPFNPILGETFELDCGSGVRFLAEQARARAMESVHTLALQAYRPCCVQGAGAQWRDAGAPGLDVQPARARRPPAPL